MISTYSLQPWSLRETTEGKIIERDTKHRRWHRAGQGIDEQVGEDVRSQWPSTPGSVLSGSTELRHSVTLGTCAQFIGAQTDRRQTCSAQRFGLTIEEPLEIAKVKPPDVCLTHQLR
jgi:hypothetical protein